MEAYLTERKGLYQVHPKRSAPVGNYILSTTERDIARSLEQVEILLSKDEELLGEK